MEIGQKLKESRTAAGLSQEALAQQLGVTRQTVSSWEKNRSYPDIGSLIKLSDLYGLSLDELLKEDPVMKKHVEDSGPLPRKYWNRLFEIAILLNPFGSLVGYWGAPWAGLVLRLIGAVMLPPLWVARYKLFGMPKEEMAASIKGWVLWFVGSFVCILDGYFGMIGYIMVIAGLLMILGNGIYLERGTRFWLIIALWIGIPIYIYLSGASAYLESKGSFSEAQPFGHHYRIVEVEYGQLPESTPTLELSMLNNGLRLDGESIGTFSYIEPLAEQTEKGIWQLIPEDSPGTLYKLVVNAEDETTLACFADDQLQWRWEIAPLPTGQFTLRVLGSVSISPMDWFPSDRTEEPDYINYTTFSDGQKASVRIPGCFAESITVKEVYHRDDQTEINEYQLQMDKSGAYLFPEDFGKRYADGEQYAIYSIEWEGGEFLFRLNFQ